MAKKKKKAQDVVEEQQDTLETQENTEVDVNEEEAQVDADQTDGKKKKKGKKKDKKQKGEAPKFVIHHKGAKPDTVEEAEAKQEIYGIIKTTNRLKRLRRWFAALVTLIFLFVSGSYLIYYYTDISDWEMTTTTHDHQYNEEGHYVVGDCKNKGYTEFTCLYLGCNSYRREYEKDFGAHKFSELQVTSYVDNQGKTHKVYTCYVCREYTNDIIVGA